MSCDREHQDSKVGLRKLLRQSSLSRPRPEGILIRKVGVWGSIRSGGGTEMVSLTLQKP